MTTITEMPDFQTALERQIWFELHADFFVATIRVNRVAYRGEFESLSKARYAAQHIADKLNKPVLIYSVVGESAEWIENCYP